MIRIKKSSKKEALYALKFAGWVLFTIFTLGLLFGGAVHVAEPIGWLALAAAFVILLVTIQQWGKQLYGLLFLAAFNALIMAGSGHNFSYPPVSVPRWQALTLAGLLALSAFLCRWNENFRLRVIDKAALLLFIGCFVWSIGSGLVIVPLAVGAAGLAVARGLAHSHRGKGEQDTSSASRTAD